MIGLRVEKEYESRLWRGTVDRYDNVNQLYEEQKNNGLSDKSIIEYFDSLINIPQNTITQKEFFDSLINIFGNLTISENNKEKLTKEIRDKQIVEYLKKRKKGKLIVNKGNPSINKETPSINKENKSIKQCVTCNNKNKEKNKEKDKEKEKNKNKRNK